MGELRWILLAAGAVFVLGLALWELRRPRHAAGTGEVPEAGAARRLPEGGEPAGMQASPASALDLPEIRAVDARRDPPVLMLDEVRATERDVAVEVAIEVAIDRPGHSGAAPPAQSAQQAAAAAPERGAAPPAIQWPPQRQERIIWLRVVPRLDGRFNGRALRQALTGSGLVHGPQDIFHWVDDAGHVVASAASLTRPGSFDLAVMDTQQFLGVHVFAVLPGPLAPLQTLDELLGLARDIASRLSGEVQDERGAPLDAARIEQLRDSLRTQAPVQPDAEDGEADA